MFLLILIIVRYIKNKNIYIVMEDKNTIYYIFMLLVLVLLFFGVISTTPLAINNNPIDENSNSLIVIDFAHHEVHEGDSYVLTNQANLGSGASFDYIINTSGMNGKQAHIIVLARSTAEANLFIYENVTFTGGTPNGEVNRNRNSDNIAKATILEASNILTRQTKMFEQHFGSGKSIGGQSRNTLEFILKENETYSIEFTSESPGNDISWIIEWYEHTPSNR